MHKRVNGSRVGSTPGLLVHSRLRRIDSPWPTSEGLFVYADGNESKLTVEFIALAFSELGDRLAAASHDGELHVFEPDGLREIDRTAIADCIA